MCLINLGHYTDEQIDLIIKLERAIARGVRQPARLKPDELLGRALEPLQSWWKLAP
jgi:hypothetical protein